MKNDYLNEIFKIKWLEDKIEGFLRATVMTKTKSWNF